MNRETLKNYLNSEYQGSDSFLENIIYPIFGENDFENEYETELLENMPEYQNIAQATGIQSIKQIGRIYIEVEPLQIFDITVSDYVIMERNRVGIQRLIRSVMDQFSCAFMIFHYDDNVRWDWRFSFCHKKDRNEEFTDSKRYTYILGPRQSCRTATEKFIEIYNKKGHIEIKDIEQAFSVEVLSKEFFGKYKGFYEKFVCHMTSNSQIRNNFIDTSFDQTSMAIDKVREREEKPIRDYVKKLLGRIVFLHFLQKKGWLGVPMDKDWGDGDRDFMLHLFQRASDNQKNDFLDSVLEPLFSDALDSNRSSEKDKFDTNVEGLREIRIPYLNGGLFERDELDKKSCSFPSNLFEELLVMLSQYNFTIDENDPNDAEVGIDPEMLGRIFENLLEDNKDKGAYYTPKEIVQYMCRESLIAYLQTDIEKEDEKDRIRRFVLSHDVQDIEDIKKDIDEKLKEVKICDPAIGSGAFPMGLLKELFYCRTAIESNSNESAADIKRHIIQNNIYGVDIERGAVDIARLRFWLSLIVDEVSPITLPNLDFKIMQGNSLLEHWHGIDLSTFSSDTKVEEPQKNLFGLYDQRELNITFSRNDDVDDLQKLLNKYFNEDNNEEKEKYRIKICENIRKQITYNINKRLLHTESLVNDLSIGCALSTKKIQDELALQKENIMLYKRLLNEVTTLDVINNQFFLWHIWFSNIFSTPDKEGFDIVIGNPPYIQLQNNSGEFSNIYEDCKYKTFVRTGDIYCLFYERGCQLLKPHGHLCFITSNKWMRAGYGEKIRSFLAENTNPKLLIDFAGVKIFESATVDTNILLLSKSLNEHKTVCAVANKLNENGLFNLSLFVQQQSILCSFSGSDSWVILSPIEQSIKKKIETIGTPLKDWNIQIYRGVLTGYNDAFIISTEKREEILANCKSEDERKRTAELIRPILRGRDIKRYGYDWANLWLINTHNGVKGKIPRIIIEDYPAIKAHLDKYWDKISCRADKGETPYNLRNCAYLEDFSKPKVIYPETTMGANFAYDEKGMLIDKTCFMFLSSEAKYLQATLSSKLFEFAYKRIYSSVELGAHGYQYNKHALIKLPICRNHTNNSIYTDSYIYNLYNLTPEERNIVDSFIETQ